MAKSHESLLGEGVVTVAQAAEELHLSKTRIYELIRAGAMTHITVGVRVLIPRATLRAYLAKRMTIGSVA